MGWQEKARELRGFVWANLDALLVVVVAFAIVVAEIVAEPSRALVETAILAVLGVTAIVLLRDRGHRIELDGVRKLAGDAISDRPFEVVRQTKQWDLRDRDTAVVTLTEQLRFTRNDVATISHWTQADGSVQRNVAKWRRSEARSWISATMIHRLSVRGGEKAIYCLEEEQNRGDELDWCIEEEARGRFSKEHEKVGFRARAKSDHHPRMMKILWPSDLPPSHVEIRRGSEPAQTLAVRRKNGRPCVEHRVSGLAVGETVEISWTW